MTRLMLLISLLGFVTCSHELKSQKIIKDDQEILFGKISKEQLYFDFPEWQEEEQFYKPIDDITKQISENNRQINVIIFLGSWCGDSRTNVPAFFKSVEHNKSIKYELWAVDESKSLDNDLIKKYKIDRVPTFIFEADGEEIGRITEFPDESMEEDILKILTNNQNN